MNSKLRTAAVTLFLLASAGLLAAACGTDLKPLEQDVATVKQDVAAMKGQTGKLAAQARQIEITVTGAELKGTTSTDSLSAPSVSPVNLSAGYRYKQPGEADKNDPKKWEVSTYVWLPTAVTALQGDQITLRVFAVNGDKHDSWVEAPDGKKVATQMVERGREYMMKFTAEQAGTYKLMCSSHAPTMTSLITVLPRT